MEKGENAGYQDLLHFPQCFQKVCFSVASKGVIVSVGMGKIQCLCQGRKHCGKRRTHLSKENMSKLKVLDSDKVRNVLK